MNVLIDRHSMQAVAHLNDEVRLGDMIEHLRSSLSCSVALTRGPVLSARELTSCDVLMIPTRSIWMAAICSERADLAFTEDEVDAVVAFVQEGGGLFLLSNHGEIGPKVPDHTQQDAMLARALGLELDCAAFARRGTGNAQGRPSLLGPGALTAISGACLSSVHPICRSGRRAVNEIVTNNCTSIPTTTGVPLVTLPPTMADLTHVLEPDGRAFAVAIDGTDHSEVGSGRVVLCGDSGFLGSPKTGFPGPGLFDRGDNAAFVTNAVEWLHRR